MAGPSPSPIAFLRPFVAAGFLTDWKGLVNRFNSPGSPRAD